MSESTESFSDTVAGMIAGLPPVIDPSAPREEFAEVGRRIGRLGSLVGDIDEQQRADFHRLRELGERLLAKDERPEVDACIGRMLDGERAGDLARAWWNANQEPLRVLATRMGSDGRLMPVGEFPVSLPAENYEVRAWLRRARRQVSGTVTQRLKWSVAGRLAEVLRSTGTALRRRAGDPPG